ncbi:type III secretion system stalk subunit SctO [Chelativorans salis]|uniref:YscO family type III secretion system apparatus protein n=1 Tax=Chelativorans salis TaxID=2978478 RepID=A0ABT2LTY2_9HYPH|nr:YscO family type III secretion system apparatus protein [Chelativorans sp. EGI FJ00035]MCT7376833.1 YscO family type III secretion system apparatus protein [Chelativorans sp. EGI FJ00035]
MKERETIVRLRDLRRLRERGANETVFRRHAALNEAKWEVEKAAHTTERHLQEAAAAEQSEFESLVGQPVDVRRMHQLEGQFQKGTADLARLRDVELQAAATARERKDQLARAREDHNRHMRAVTKLDGLLDRLSSRSIGGWARCEEFEEEETAADRRPSKHKGGL